MRAAAARVRDGGLATVAVDTELLGLHWHEGPQWLAAVLEEAERAGLRVAPLDDAARRRPTRRRRCRSRRGARRATSPPGAAPARPGSRGASATPSCARSRPARSVPERALRELLALQSSDWAFLATHRTAGDYPLERAAGHAAAFAAALARRASRRRCAGSPRTSIRAALFAA